MKAYMARRSMLFLQTSESKSLATSSLPREDHVEYSTLRVPLVHASRRGAYRSIVHRHTGWRKWEQGWRKWEQGWRDRVPEIDVDRRVEVGAALPLVLGRRQPFEERLHVRRYGEPHRS